jgi:hypothetical protein
MAVHRLIIAPHVGMLQESRDVSAKCRHRIPPQAASVVRAAEFFLLVLFFDFRRGHGLRKGQREAWPRFCVSALDSSTSRFLRFM